MSEFLAGIAVAALGFGAAHKAGDVLGSEGSAILYPLLLVGGILVGIFGAGAMVHGLGEMSGAVSLIASIALGIVAAILFIGKRAGGAA